MTAFLSYLRGGSPIFPWFRALVLVLLSLSVLTLGRVPLIDEDEGEYSEVAAEMVQTGNWLSPTLNATPFYEKPILLFWAQAPLVQFFGPVEWAFRLPALAATALMLLLLYRRLHLRLGEEGAMAVIATFGLSLGEVLVARAATMDALLLLFLTVTLLSLWDYLATGRRSALRWAYVAMALGFLSKGPVAILIPGAVMVVFALLERQYRGAVVRSLDGIGILLFLGIAAPWFVWYDLHTQGAFVDYFFLRENLGRIRGSLQGHSGVLGYYVLVLPLILLPFSALLLGVVKAYREDRRDPWVCFLLLWFAVVFVMFSLAGTKLPHYLLYGLPPVFILGVRAYLKSTRLGLLFLPSLLLPGLAMALPFVVSHFAMRTNNPYVAEMLSQGRAYFDAAYLWKSWVWLLLTLFVIQRAFRQPTSATRLPLVAALGVVSAFGVSLVLLPAVSALQQDPVREAAWMARGLSDTVVSDQRMPSFSVYLGHPTEVRLPQVGDIAFGRLDHPDRLGSRYEVLYARQGIRLVRVGAP